jgi:hypothetical protein
MKNVKLWPSSSEEEMLNAVSLFLRTLFALFVRFAFRGDRASSALTPKTQYAVQKQTGTNRYLIHT